MRYVPFIDSTGIHNFKEVIKTLKGSGVNVVLSGVQPSVYACLNKSEIVHLIDKANMFDTFEHAINHAKTMLETEDMAIN